MKGLQGEESEQLHHPSYIQQSQQQQTQPQQQRPSSPRSSVESTRSWSSYLPKYTDEKVSSSQKQPLLPPHDDAHAPDARQTRLNRIKSRWSSLSKVKKFLVSALLVWFTVFGVGHLFNAMRFGHYHQHRGGWGAWGHGHGRGGWGRGGFGMSRYGGEGGYGGHIGIGGGGGWGCGGNWGVGGDDGEEFGRGMRGWRSGSSDEEFDFAREEETPVVTNPSFVATASVDNHNVQITSTPVIIDLAKSVSISYVNSVSGKVIVTKNDVGMMNANDEENGKAYILIESTLPGQDQASIDDVQSGVELSETSYSLSLEVGKGLPLASDHVVTISIPSDVDTIPSLTVNGENIFLHIDESARELTFEDLNVQVGNGDIVLGDEDNKINIGSGWLTSSTGKIEGDYNVSKVLVLKTTTGDITANIAIKKPPFPPHHNGSHPFPPFPHHGNRSHPHPPGPPPHKGPGGPPPHSPPPHHGPPPPPPHHGPPGPPQSEFWQGGSSMRGGRGRRGGRREQSRPGFWKRWFSDSESESTDDSETINFEEGDWVVDEFEYDDAEAYDVMDVENPESQEDAEFPPPPPEDGEHPPFPPPPPGKGPKKGPKGPKGPGGPPPPHKGPGGPPPPPPHKGPGGPPGPHPPFPPHGPPPAKVVAFSITGKISITYTEQPKWRGLISKVGSKTGSVSVSLAENFKGLFKAGARVGQVVLENPHEKNSTITKEFKSETGAFVEGFTKPASTNFTEFDGFVYDPQEAQDGSESSEMSWLEFEREMESHRPGRRHRFDAGFNGINRRGVRTSFRRTPLPYSRGERRYIKRDGRGRWQPESEFDGPRPPFPPPPPPHGRPPFPPPPPPKKGPHPPGPPHGPHPPPPPFHPPPPPPGFGFSGTFTEVGKVTLVV